MKKLISLVLLSSLIICSSVSSFAKNKENEITADKVIKEYALKTITMNNVPDGVKPLVFDNAKEADEYFANLKKNAEIESTKALENVVDSKQSQTLVKGNMVLAALPSAEKGDQTKKVGTWGIGSANMKVTYTYYPSIHKFESCTGIDVYLSDVTIGTSWSRVSDTDYDFLDNMRTLACKESGTLNHYVFFEGIGTLYQEPRDYYQLITYERIPHALRYYWSLG